MKIGNATIKPNFPGILALGSSLFFAAAICHDDRNLDGFDSIHGTNFSDFAITSKRTNLKLANAWVDDMATFSPDGDNKLNAKEEARARELVAALKAYEAGTWVFSPRSNSAFFERALNDRVEIEKE